MSYDDFYNDFVDDAWEDFREYASPKLKSVLREIGILAVLQRLYMSHFFMKISRYRHQVADTAEFG